MICKTRLMQFHFFRFFCRSWSCVMPWWRSTGAGWLKEKKSKWSEGERQERGCISIGLKILISESEWNHILFSFFIFCARSNNNELISFSLFNLATWGFWNCRRQVHFNCIIWHKSWTFMAKRLLQLCRNFRGIIHSFAWIYCSGGLHWIELSLDFELTVGRKEPSLLTLFRFETTRRRGKAPIWG